MRRFFNLFYDSCRKAKKIFIPFCVAASVLVSAAPSPTFAEDSLFVDMVDEEEIGFSLFIDEEQNADNAEDILESFPGQDAAETVEDSDDAYIDLVGDEELSFIEFADEEDSANEEYPEEEYFEIDSFEGNEDIGSEASGSEDIQERSLEDVLFDEDDNIDVYPEEYQTEAETSTVSDMDLQNDPVSETETELETDGLFDILTEEAGSDEGELYEEEETIDLDSPEAAPGTDNATASTARVRRLLRAASSNAGGSSSYVYGTQLSGNALAFYEYLVDLYITNGSTVLEPKCEISETLGFDISAYTTTDVTIITNDNGTKSLDKTTASYKAMCAQITADVQSAWDAFCYDYPELFWYHAKSIKMSVKYTSKQAWFPSVTIIAMEKFENAISFSADFQSGISQVISQIETTADYNMDGTLSDLEVIQAAHDYIINRMSYDNARLSTYTADLNAGNTITDYTIFNAAGAFVDDDSIGTSFVCEGYAKAFKILCDRFGITCVLVPGLGSPNSTIGHMWNAVQVNGSWHLVDCTWDDTVDGPKYTYFMFAYNSANNGSSDSRAPYRRFSDDKNQAQTFTTPSTTGSGHTFQIYRSKAADCVGYTEYTCADYDGISYIVISASGAKGHSLNEQGICTACGEYDLSNDEIRKTGGGNWDLYFGDVKIDRQNFDLIENKDASGVLVSYTAYGIGEYTGELTFSPYSLSDMTISEDHITYDGQRQKPSAALSLDQLVLQEGQDYTIESDDEMIEPGQYTIQIIGIGLYEGQSVTAKYTIEKAALSSADLSEISYIYTGNVLTPDVLNVKTEGGLVVDSEAYTTSYTNNTNAGTATVTITAKSGTNFTGTVIKTFSIEKAILSSADLSGASSTYTGDAFTPDVSNVKTENGLSVSSGDYTVAYTNNINAGTATVTIAARSGTNYSGTVTRTFTIGKAALSSADLSGTTFTYTGSVITPTVSNVKTSNDVNVDSSSYTVSYTNNTNAGTATVTIAAKSGTNYSGTVTRTFTIGKAALSSADLSGTTFTYTGSAITPTVSNVKTSNGLTAGSGAYTVTYANNTNAGTASVTIAAKSGTNYSGTVTRTFTIGKAALSSADLSGTTFTYTGSAITPTVSNVKTANGLYVGSGAYTVTYASNTNAGTASVTIAAKSGTNYSGTVTRTFTIGKAALSSADLSGTTFTYTGSGITPTVSNVKTANGLTAGSGAYTVTYANNTNAGIASVTIAAKSGTNYSGTVTRTFTIGKAALSSADLSGTTFTYTGSAITPTVSNVKTANGLYVGSGAYTVSYANNIDAGTATVSITANGGTNYSGTVTRTYTITPASLTGVSLSKSSVTYNGKVRTVGVKVTSAAGTPKIGTDYTVKYKNNKKIGTAQVTVTGKGNYTGILKATFRILPKKAKLKQVTAAGSGKVTVKWSKISGVTGYQIRYSRKKSFAGAKTLQIKKSSTVKTTLKKLTKKKTYYVSIRAYKTVKGIRYYGAWSTAKKVKVK